MLSCTRVGSVPRLLVANAQVVTSAAAASAAQLPVFVAIMTGEVLSRSL